LTRLFVQCRAVAAAAFVVGLGGCELLKHNEEALSIINARVLGKPAGEFFDRYGRASKRIEAGVDATVYDWASDIPLAAPGPDSRDERICKLRLTVDKAGRVSAVQVLFDAPGRKSTSRCGEIFAAS
jgi:hypothetical protein